MRRVAQFACLCLVTGAAVMARSDRPATSDEAAGERAKVTLTVARIAEILDNEDVPVLHHLPRVQCHRKEQGA